MSIPVTARFYKIIEDGFTLEEVYSSWNGKENKTGRFCTVSYDTKDINEAWNRVMEWLEFEDDKLVWPKFDLLEVQFGDKKIIKYKNEYKKGLDNGS